MMSKFDQQLPQQVAACLCGPLPGWRAQRRFAPELAYGRHHVPPPSDARRAAVMLMLYRDGEDWFLPLILRPQSMPLHAGQVSFPGGLAEQDESSEATALRELAEELGIQQQRVTVLGQLSPLYIFASNSLVTPVLAWNEGRPHFKPDAREVAQLLTPRVAELLDISRHDEHWIERQRVRFRAPSIQLDRHVIWGATAMILAELMALLERRSCDLAV